MIWRDLYQGQGDIYQGLQGASLRAFGSALICLGNGLFLLGGLVLLVPLFLAILAYVWPAGILLCLFGGPLCIALGQTLRVVA